MWTSTPRACWLTEAELPGADRRARSLSITRLGRSGLRPATLRSVIEHVRHAFEQRDAEARRRAGIDRSDLIAWGQHFLPGYFRAEPSEMHRWLAEQLDAMTRERGRKVNVLGPRGAAKSTLATVAFVLRAAVEASEPYIWIVSDTKQQARGHLENVKLELLENPVLREVYPHATGRGPTWRTGTVVLRNGVMIEAFGTGQRIRGRRRKEFRPTLIVCDDLQNDGHVQSALQRDRSRAWFHSALMKAGTPTTNVVNLATALHREALAMELHTTGGWSSRRFQSIVQWPSNLQLWHDWQQIHLCASDPAAAQHARDFYQANRAAMDHGAQVLWPSVENLYTLMCMRAEGGHTAFEREKQNSPVNPDQCEWPETYFGEWMWFDEWPTNLMVKVIALDPSKGQDSRISDYSAYALVGVHSDGTLFVEADLARRPTPAMVDEGVALCAQFRPHALVIETNQYQHLLEGTFQQALLEQRLLTLPIWPVDNQVNKNVRIRRLGPLLAARKLRFKAGSASTRLLVDQLRDFPQASHDDGPDALEMAIRIAGELLHNPTPDDGLGDHLI